MGSSVVARLMVGSMMIVHGADKLAGEPAMFGKFVDGLLFSTGGVLGGLVILLEFVGGTVELDFEFLPRPEYGLTVPMVHPHAGGAPTRGSPEDYVVSSPVHRARYYGE